VTWWIAVSGYKDTGKTTLLCGVVRALADIGLRVATVKRDSHGFTAFPPATDSARLAVAGAAASAVLGPQGHTAFDLGHATADAVWAVLRAHDVVLVEGGKSLALAKVAMAASADAVGGDWRVPAFAWDDLVSGRLLCVAAPGRVRPGARLLPLDDRFPRPGPPLLSRSDSGRVADVILQELARTRPASEATSLQWVVELLHRH
jgi:molybdopterin-guanine dinucleotide biosynthesis protein MobB